MTKAELANQPTSVILTELEKRNRRFKVFGVAFMFCSALALIAIILVGLNNLQSANKQLEQQKVLLESQKETLDAISAAADQRTAQLAKISAQIDCIAQFFTQKNRTYVVITDLEQCEILRADGTISPGTGTGNNSMPQSTAPENKPTPTSTQPLEVGSGTPEPPAKEVLGIPLCIPFTSVCLR